MDKAAVRNSVPGVALGDAFGQARTGLTAVPATWLSAREPIPDRVW